MRNRNKKAKAIFITSIASLLLVSSSWTVRRVEERVEPEKPSIQMLKYAQNLYRLSGYNGEAKVYIDRWPEYADYIMQED